MIISVNIEHIFNQVLQRTLYIADQIDTALGEMMIDKIPITEDDRSFFKIALRDASVKIALIVSPLTKGITQPFVVNETDGVVSFTLDESKSSTQLPILETVLPGLIMRGIVLWITAEWLRIKGLNASYYITETQELEIVKNEIKSISKQKTTRLKYKMF